jgi:hypothetical protein
MNDLSTLDALGKSRFFQLGPGFYFSVSHYKGLMHKGGYLFLGSDYLCRSNAEFIHPGLFNIHRQLLLSANPEERQPDPLNDVSDVKISENYLFLRTWLKAFLDRNEAQSQSL